MSPGAAAPAVSVLTVCFNAAPVLAGTIASLQAQRAGRWEWVVVDGGSRDGTQHLVQAAATPPSVFVSEPDRGIYDAMNKAVARSSGEVLYFLNADDRLHDADVLADVAAQFDADPALDLLHGDVVYEYPGHSLVKHSRWINAATLPFEDLCHQAVFARRRVFERVGGFDLRWPTSADYDWLLRVWRSGARVRHWPRRVAYFKAGGAHERDPAALAAERRAIRLQYLSPLVLQAGQLASRSAHRVSRTLRGGLWIGQQRLER